MFFKMIRYVTITFSITYLFWGFDIALSSMGLYEHPGYNIGIIFYIIAACAPAIAAIVLWKKEQANLGLKKILKKIFHLSNPVLELSLLAVFLSIRFVIPFLSGDVRITGRLWQVVVFTPVMLLFGGFEEVGWRGNLQPMLEKKCGFIIATLINYAVWLVWHIPLCFIKGTYQYSGSYLWFAVSLLGSAFCTSALRKVKDNIMPCILFHAIGNAVVSYGLTVNNGISILVSCGLQVLAAILVSVFFGRAKKENGGKYVSSNASYKTADI